MALSVIVVTFGAVPSPFLDWILDAARILTAIRRMQLPVHLKSIRTNDECVVGLLAFGLR